MMRRTIHLHRSAGTRHNAALDGIKLPRSRRIAAKARCHDESGCRGNARGCALAYKMVAERDNEKCSFARESRLLIVAKAKVWASEGWKVVITDQDGKAYAPPEFDQLLAA
ncbi:hypothetical protein ACVWWO_009311 [Bradyrhizobium sp. F1.13.1]|uniref:hypothetical protein n=1 Tax=Bradyrhizobium sp. JR4.3 TaxID=3156373 RepID=UPI0033981209